MLRKKKAFYLILGIFTSVCMTFTGITGNILQQPTIAYAEGDTTIPEGGVTGEYDGFKGTLSEDGTLRISKTGGNNAVDPYSFLSSSGLSQYGNFIKKLIIEEGIVTLLNGNIGASSSKCITLYAPNIEQVVLPNSCTTIQRNVFRELHKLQSVKLGNNTTSISYCAFCDCNLLKNIKLQPTMLIQGAFYNNSLKTVDLPDGIKFGPNDDIPFYNCLALENIIVEGDYSRTSSMKVFTLDSGVYLKKIVYLKSTWDKQLIYESDKHINANTTIYCTEENYESVYTALSSTGAKFKKVTGIDDLASSTISDDNVSIDDIINGIEEFTTGDEAVVAIEGQTDHAVIKLSVPTEVGFVISPRTKSKFVTREFEVVNQTGAPVKFTLQGLEPTSSSNELKLLRRDHWNDKYGDEAKTSWRKLGPEDTEKGIALKCYFDADKDGEYEYTFWETPIEDDLTEITFNLSEDGSFKGKLDALYGLAWTTDYTGSYQLKGTVELGTNL